MASALYTDVKRKNNSSIFTRFESTTLWLAALAGNAAPLCAAPVREGSHHTASLLPSVCLGVALLHVCHRLWEPTCNPQTCCPSKHSASGRQVCSISSPSCLPGSPAGRMQPRRLPSSCCSPSPPAAASGCMAHWLPLTRGGHHARVTGPHAGMLDLATTAVAGCLAAWLAACLTSVDRVDRALHESRSARMPADTSRRLPVHRLSGRLPRSGPLAAWLTGCLRDCLAGRLHA
jgi:hypothetical protein